MGLSSQSATIDDFETDGADLPTIDRPASENQLISAVAAANPDTVIVLNTGSAVILPLIAHVNLGGNG